MEGWPRIPNQNGNASSSRPKASIPAPGTVVMASVEEDLGDGMYSLRWGGNRIAVSSRSPLTPGQSLILKSETNAEGKPTLVVQGPALPEPGSITGRVIYGPGKNRAQPQPQPQSQPEPEAPRSEVRQGMGNPVAAGTAPATPAQPPTPAQPVRDLIGLVLEPLPEFEASVKVLEKVVAEEKERLEGDEAGGEGELQGEDGEAAEKPVRHDRPDRPAAMARPTPLPGAAVGAGRGEAAAQPPAGAEARPAPVAPASPPVADPQGAVPARPAPTPVPGTPISPQAVDPRPVQVPDVPPLAEGGSTPQAAERPAPAPSSPAAPSPQPVPAAPEGIPPQAVDPRPVQVPEVPPPAATGSLQAATPQPIPAPGAPSPVPAAPQPIPPHALDPRPVQVPDVPPPAASGTPPVATPQPVPTPVAPSPLPAVPSAPEVILPQAVDPRPAQVPDVPPPAASGSPQATTPQPIPEPVAPSPLPAVSSAPEVIPPQAVDPHPVQVPDVPPPTASGTPPAATPQPNPAPVVPSPLPAMPSAPEVIPPQAVDPRPVQVPDVPPPTASETPPPATPQPVPAVNPRPIQVPDVPPPAASGTPPPVMSQPVQAPDAPPATVPAQSVEPRPEPSAPAPPSPATPSAPEAIPQAVDPRPVPVPDAPAPARGSATYGPPRRDTGTLHQRQAALPAAAGETVPADGAERAEAVFKEALTQMVKAAALPLAGDAATPPLAVAGKPPQAVVDKAAELFLQAAGFVPDEETMDAARALVRHSVQVDRDSVQALVDAAAAAPPEEREAVLNAAARLLSKDVPVAPPLVAGMAQVLDRSAGAHVLMERAAAALALDTGMPEAQPLLDDARALLDMLHVDLGRADAAAALERYCTTFGREALGKALALVETAAQAVLETSPELQKLDQAIAAVLGELTDDLAVEQQRQLAQEGSPPKPGLSLEQLPSPPPEAAPAAPPRPPPAISAYLNAPRAFNIAEALKNLPPMPKLVTLNMPPPPEGAAGAQPPQPQPVPAPLPAPQPAPVAPGPAPMPLPGESSVLLKLDSLFRMPGLNARELDLLRPSGFLDRFLNSAAPDAPDPERVRQEARALMRQLTSDNAEQVERGLREVKTAGKEVLREAAARLSERESEVVRANTVLNRLADAATSLRDLGRQLLAVKAENLAGQDREPGVMLAEVPFKLNDNAGDGRMQMFYRRSKGKKDGWSSRVILDLNTTRMGPVLGDMRFFGQDMALNMFVERQETAGYLEASAGDLAAGLADKGFRLKARFMVLPPRSAPEIRAERPHIAGEEALPAPADGDRKLDIKG